MKKMLLSILFSLASQSLFSVPVFEPIVGQKSPLMMLEDPFTSQKSPSISKKRKQKELERLIEDEAKRHVIEQEAIVELMIVDELAGHNIVEELVGHIIARGLQK